MLQTPKNDCGVIVDAVDLASSNKKGALRVLLVDDDPSILEISKQILMDMGSFEFAQACCVDEAFKKLATGQYDVVVSDYEMPQKDGLQFLKELRKQNNKIPFILFTGKGREEVAIQALNLGADGYYNKQGSPETVYGELAHGMRLSAGQRIAEMEICQREEKLKGVFASSPDAIMISDLNGNIVDCNEAALKLGEYSSKEEIFGKNALDFISEKDRKKALDNLTEIFIQGTIRNAEYTALKKNGGEYLACLSANLLRDSTGNPTGFVSVIMDITERKKAEAELKMAANVFSLATDSIFVIDTEGNIVSFNEAAYKVRGYTKEEMSKMNIQVLDAPEYSVPFESRVKQLLARGSAVFEAVHVCKDKTRLPVEIHARMVAIEGKKLILSVVRDISERKAAEEQLKDRNLRIELMNEKLRVVGGLTRHDVGNMLMVIKSNVYLLKQQIGNNPKLAKYLEGIDNAINQSDKIFEYSRFYEKIGAEKPLKIDVAQCFNQAVALLHNLGATRIINDCQGLEVTADSLLLQLFYNFLDNSLRHGEKVTQIRLHYTKKGDAVKLCYEDNGVGIPDADKPKLFTEGFSTGRSRGLGMFFAKKMVEVYNWTITEEGEPGKGAKFVITIPELLLEN